MQNDYVTIQSAIISWNFNRRGIAFLPLGIIPNIYKIHLGSN